MAGALIADLYASVLPSVGRQPLPSMPRRLYGYVWKVSGRNQVRLCLITLLVFPLSLAPLELQRRMIDGAVANDDVRLLLLLGAIYFAVLLLHGGLKYIRNLYQNRIAEGVVRLLRLRIAKAETFGTEADAGTKQTILSAESERLGGFVGESMSFPLLQAGIVLSVAGYMLIVEPLIAVVALAFLIPSLVIVPIIQQRVNRLAEQKTHLSRELAARVLEQDGASEASVEEPDNLIVEIYGVRLRIFTLKYGMKFLNNLVGHLGPLAVLIVGGWLAIRGETGVGTIVAFISGYERMTNPARDLLNFYRRLSSMRVQYRLVREASLAA